MTLVRLEGAVYSSIRAGALAGLMLSSFCGWCSAESYRVQLGDLPPVYVPDVWSYGLQIEIDPPPAKSLSALGPVRNAGKLAFPPLPAGGDRTAVKLAPPAKPGPPTSQVLADEFLLPSKTPPTKDFLAQIAKAYNVTKPAEQEAVWKWYQQEPATLGNVERLDNAFIRYTMAASLQKPAGLNPQATGGTVNAPFPLAMRKTPFGARTATIYKGAAVTILPPPDGAWYRVDTPQGPGWLCGLWIDAK
ncbi:MAG: hypothetical protein HY303_13925 [Candidatus Wallbacteria bacterium]|nr:hypothetical protein [Candidatus Wallbacteria bacterium]